VAFVRLGYTSHCTALVMVTEGAITNHDDPETCRNKLTTQAYLICNSVVAQTQTNDPRSIDIDAWTTIV
jgi:hypothetical protein